MKKLTTFLAASLLGLSSLASAAPSLEVHAGGSIRVTASASASAHGQVIVRDHRTPTYRPVVEQQVPVHTSYSEVTWTRPAPAWFTLGTVATGKQTIVPSNRLLDSLTFEVEGRVEIEKVAIFFEGQTSPQISKLDAVLTERSRMPVINLAGTNREIKRVIVYSTASASGEITVLGRNDRDAAQIVMPGWSKLAAMGTGKQMFALETERRYSSLALVGSGSNIELEQVVVRYTDGTQQNFKLDAMLGTNRRAAAIELQNKKVKSVIVYTDADATGDVMLFAK
jgi:hypothetical protein